MHTITLLGKLKVKTLVERHSQERLVLSGPDYYFVDFSNTEVKLNSHNASAKLVEIGDGYGNFLDAIPKGWKTICKIIFTEMPDEVKNLPELDGWEYNPKPYKLTMQDRKIKQVIIVRKDLKNKNGQKVHTGKLIAQGSHASMAFLTRDAGIVNGFFTNKYIKNLDEVMQWCEEGFTKVCLKVESEGDLMKVFKEAQKAGLNVHLITDSGFTEFAEPTRTAIAIGPNQVEDIDKVTGHLSLF